MNKRKPYVICYLQRSNDYNYVDKVTEKGFNTHLFLFFTSFSDLFVEVSRAKALNSFQKFIIKPPADLAPSYYRILWSIPAGFKKEFINFLYSVVAPGLKKRPTLKNYKPEEQEKPKTVGKTPPKRARFDDRRRKKQKPIRILSAEEKAERQKNRATLEINGIRI